LRFGAALLVLASGAAGCGSVPDPASLERLIRERGRTNPPLEIIPGRAVGPLRFGMTRAQVRAAIGPPQGRQDSVWHYWLLGLAVSFGGDGRLDTIHAGAGCPPESPLIDAFKGQIGGRPLMRATREDVLAALGRPSSIDSPSANEEVLWYKALGIVLTLDSGRVRQISLWRPDEVSIQ
jgi:hypothetical protein